MTIVSPKQFLEDQFPKRYWPLIPTTLRSAYKAVDVLVDTEPILQVVSAGYNKGRLVSYAVDLGFQRLIDVGQLPFGYRWKPFYRPTGRYLQIQLPHSVLSINRVAAPHKQPRNVWFRENLRLSNQFAFDLPEFAEELEVQGMPHFLLVHGHQTLDFSHLGVPDPIHRRHYRYQTPNLLGVPHALPSDVPPVEETDTDFDAIDLLKEEIEKWRTESGE